MYVATSAHLCGISTNITTALVSKILELMCMWPFKALCDKTNQPKDTNRAASKKKKNTRGVLPAPLFQKDFL